ncbi:hypothetical protein BN903_113 [Halorubrum sp. AJ67]|nr:hypothetical protein BN903_113 [Halorubrum sp. AJ67]
MASSRRVVEREATARGLPVDDRPHRVVDGLAHAVGREVLVQPHPAVEQEAVLGVVEVGVAGGLK